MAGKEKVPVAASAATATAAAAATSAAAAVTTRGKIHPDLHPIVKMLEYRGYRKIEVLKTSTFPGGYHLVLGTDQKYEHHPRPGAQTLVLYDTGPSFSSPAVLKMIRTLYAEALSHKLPPDSSIVYVYIYPISRVHAAAIERGYSSVLDEYKHEVTYYLEDMQVHLFQIDWSLPRVTRNWRLHSEDYYIIMYTQKDEPILVDRPPLVTSNAPEIKYLGGRPNDHASFERIESMEVGPMWISTMRKIGRPVELKIGEMSVDDSADVEEGSLPDR